MSDRPIAELGGKTPLEVAKIPNMNDIVKRGRIGTVRTVPRGMNPASDVANLAILGYDPKLYYSGRGPLEAANIGVELGESDVAFRCNLITANNDILSDYSAGHITDKESQTLLSYLDERLGGARIRFYHGKSYRNLMVIKARSQAEMKELKKVSCVPPHDITGRRISKHMPKGRSAGLLVRLMEDSRPVLERHQINQVRVDLKENPANMIWLWGQGTNPNMPSFRGMFGIEGAMISAVDLLNGIAKLVGLEEIKVPGATGYYDTNYAGKGQYAVSALNDKDFVFVHVEAPDEAGHNGDLRAKIAAIENFDKYVVGAVWAAMKDAEDSRLMVLSDHATPISIRTHASDPAPFVMAGKGIDHNGFTLFNEKTALLSAARFKSGSALTGAFIKGQVKESE
jgi:2,3-bisphosphoglycerate-independent phosphoglycerate mutase